MTTVVLALLSIAAGAGPVPLPAPIAALHAADADAARLAPGDAPYQRYLYLDHDEADLPKAALTQQVHWNELSTARSMGYPVRVTPRLLRIDARDHKLRLAVYEQLAQVDVFWHSSLTFVADGAVSTYWPGGFDPTQKQVMRKASYRQRFDRGETVRGQPAWWLPREVIDRLRARLWTETPILNAQWTLVQSVRDISVRNVREGAGYRDFLGYQTRAQYDAIIGIDRKETQRRLLDLRAAIKRSGISQQGRIVESARGVGGEGFNTLDTFTEQLRGVPLRNLRRGEFLHDAEEHIFPLPNGLPGNALFDAQGNAVDSAPDKIGPDDSPKRIGRDARVHNGQLSCKRCHGARNRSWEYVIPLNDWARRHFAKRALTDPDKKVLLELQAQFLEDIERPLRLAREGFRVAYARASKTPENPKGLSVYDACVLGCDEWNDYVEKPVTLARAARELGYSAAHLVAALRAYEKARGQVDNVLAGFLVDPPEVLTRLEWEDSYQFAMAIVLGRFPPDLAKREKVLP